MFEIQKVTTALGTSTVCCSPLISHGPLCPENRPNISISLFGRMMPVLQMLMLNGWLEVVAEVTRGKDFSRVS